MKIEWASHFNSDGTRRKPPASTMHGWLAKMRGTLVGNEELRSRGMQEMKKAREDRKYNARKKRQQRSTNTGKSLFSFLGIGNKSKSSHRPRTLQSGRSSGTRQSTRPSHKSASSYRSRDVRPPPRPSGPSHRTSHRNQGQSSNRPQHGPSSGHRRTSRR